MILHVPGTRFSLTVIKSILCSTCLPQSVGQYALQWCAHCICHAFGLAKHMIMWLCNTTVRLLLINLFSETYLFFIFAYNESLNTLFLCPIWKRGDILFCTHLMVVQSRPSVVAQYLLTRCQYWYSSRSVLSLLIFRSKVKVKLLVFIYNLNVVWFELGNSNKILGYTKQCLLV